MKYYLLLIFGLIYLISCNQTPSGENTVNTLKNSSINNDSLSLFFKSNGVVSFINTDANYQKGFTIFNGDGTVFMRILPSQDKVILNEKELSLSDFNTNKASFQKQGFSPKEFWPDEGFIIQFNYLSSNNNLIEVFIDSAKTITKKILLDSTLFKTETWQEHIIGTMIDFNQQKNIIRSSPSEAGTSMRLENSTEDIIFIVTKIQGEWLYIESESVCGFEKNSKYNGWIRWKNGENILIRFAYAC